MNVCYNLTDEQGKAYEAVGPDIVSIDTEATVVRFRDAVWEKNKEGLLKGRSAVELRIYKYRADAFDPTRALRISCLVGSGHEDEETALFVVVPNKTRSETMDSLDSKLEMVIDFILQMKMDMFMLAAQSVVSDNDFNKLQTHNYYSSTSISALPNHIYCQFLNIVLPTQQVTCTHIFQKHWFKERRLLNLSEINEPRNLMLLFRPIEIAFDESRIIFLWDSTSKSFKRKILDPGLRFDSKTMLPPTILDLAMRAFPKDYTPSTPVNSKFKKSLVDLEGDSLKFASSIPFKRCLAFHATRARYEAIHVHKWLQKEDFDIPEDAWSPNISESPELKSFIELWRNAE